MRRDELFSKPDLRERGWTDTMMNKFLPCPDDWRDNPFYKNAPPMEFWSTETVKEIESSPEFQAALEKSKKRKLAAQKAVQTKYRKNMAWMDQKSKEIAVIRIPMDELKKRTIEAKNVWYNYQELEFGRYDFIRASETTDADVMQRWEVNYIRHNLTSYDQTLFEARGKIGKDDGYIKYKTAVLDKIAEVYPELKDECEAQKPRTDHPEYDAPDITS